MQAAPEPERKPLPPYIAASTFLTVIESWRAVRPSRVDRGVLGKVAGSVQTWLINALRYFGLIDADGVPTQKLDELATASDSDRQRLLAEMLRTGYPFLKGVDLSNVTQNDLKRKFEETGARGDTVHKAISFYTAIAKEAGIKLSPYVLMRQRRANGAPKKTTKPKPQPPKPEPPPAATTTVSTASPMQVLINMLDVEEMDKEEQAAVWTLIRYLKKDGS